MVLGFVIITFNELIAFMQFALSCAFMLFILFLIVTLLFEQPSRAQDATQAPQCPEARDHATETT